MNATTRYADVKTGKVFFFEDNWDYPKRKLQRGHLDLRDTVTGDMPDDYPVITTTDLQFLFAILEDLEIVKQKLTSYFGGLPDNDVVMRVDELLKQLAVLDEYKRAESVV